ncbi:MAG: cytochrome c-type biogenesis protein CcmH [Proteobacteria bacterium]|nr:cytochrome c-type biogenesis protein CcmH [Pseudomonadota bacterium]
MRIILALSLALLCAFAQAKDAVPMAADEAVEKRMVAISDELRCLVCQNESLSGSHAELAQDLRREIRSLIKQGKSDAEIMDFMVSRYGDFVRYRPPLKASTYLLWFGPFLLLAGAIAALVVYLRRRGERVNTSAESLETTLSAEESRQADALLKQNDMNESENKQ